MALIKRTRNTVKKEILSKIPETVQERRLFLNKEMLKYIGKTVNCPALGVTVEFTRASYNETIRNASISKSSTIAALNIMRLIKTPHTLAWIYPKVISRKRLFNLFLFLF